jgi:putative ABC transport system permease protein
LEHEGTPLVSDIRYALRIFARRPAFAVGAIATLGLGIGAATATFSVAYAVLFRPLPYANADRLVHIWTDLTHRAVYDFPWSPADFHDLQTQVAAFDGVAALTTGGLVIGSGPGAAELVGIGGATPDVFRILGARVILGRDFADADAGPLPPQPAPPAGVGAAPIAPSPPPRAIISHEFWQRRCGGNPGVVGKVLRLGDQSFEIIGVLEPGFELLFPAGANVERAPDIWTPLQIDFAAGSRIDVFLRVIGRLQPAVSFAEAQAQVDNLASQLRTRFPIKEASGLQLRLGRMDEDLVADVRASILVLMGAVVFVLLIACANVGSLLLVRAAARDRELALRAALGGSRGHLIRQLLAESVVLGLLGAAVGIGLAWPGIRVLLSFGPDNLPRLNHVAMDPTAVAFAVVTGLASVVAFGLVPALRASRANMIDELCRTSRTNGLSASGWLRTGAVTAEVALCFVLLAGSGLMIRSFIALQGVQPGYDPRNVLTFLIPDLRLPDPEARQAFMASLKETIDALPGVLAVTAASPLPLDGRPSLARWGTEDARADPTRFQQATAYFVVPGYFEAMRTRLLEGRTFTDADNSPDARVVVIDRVLAAKAFPGGPAVGRTLLARLRTEEAERFEVIGVVDHQRHGSLAADGREGMYMPDGYGMFGSANRWAVRTAGDPGRLAQQVRAAVSALNPRAAVLDVQPMEALVERAQAQTKFALVLIGFFAAIAVALASGGLYAVLSASVRQRTVEIGVRMAFGAADVRIFRMVVGQGLRLCAAGIGAGMLAAWALTGLMQTMLVGVEPTDPLTFAGTGAGFLVIAAIACGVPALRAARTDPMAALRE